MIMIKTTVNNIATTPKTILNVLLTGWSYPDKIKDPSPNMPKVNR